MSFKALEQKISEISSLLNEKIGELLPSTKNVMEAKLFEAMRYSTLSTGKRIRPFLTVLSSQLFGVSLESSLRVAAAIEFIHTYSLIHDDLPMMDNDDYRRGQLSCHKKFGEAVAILAGDALLTFAFHVLANEKTHSDPSVRTELITLISSAAGYAGMVGGQTIDILAENQKLEYNEIVRLQRMKTGALFIASCEAGGILGKAHRNLRNSLKNYANNLGLVFQIIDDLLDIEGTKEKIGKSVRKDEKAGKATLVACLGIEGAKNRANMLATQAVDFLNGFDNRADLLRILPSYIINRER